MSKLNFTPAIVSLALIACFSLTDARAQKGGPGVEQWKSFLPYNRVNGVATDGTSFFCSTLSGFFTYNREDGSMTAYSKVNGMSDIGLNGLAYDKTTGYVILAYDNSNIDLFKDNGFTNLPEFRLSNAVSGDKTIHSVNASDGIAYMSTGVGLVKINLARKEIKETIRFYENSLAASVYASLIDNTFLYAATSVGLFRIGKTDPSVLDYTAWTKLDNKEYRLLGNSGGNIYAAEANNLYGVQPSGAPLLLEHLPDSIMHLDEGINGLWVTAADEASSKGFGILRKPDGSRIDSFFSISPTQVVHLANSEVWFGDNSGISFPDRHGLRKKTAVDRSEPFFPDGPITNGSFDVWANNGELWVAHGGKNARWGPTLSRAMFSHFGDEAWRNYSYVSENQWVQDFIRIVKDEGSGNLYAASLTGGLYEMTASGSKVYGKGYLQSGEDDSLYYLTGLALDETGTLWMTNNGSSLHELVAKTRDGQWINCQSVGDNTGHTAADVIIDQSNQKWFIAVGNGGAVVYNDNGTLENTADDHSRVFRAGKGAGNLPDNNTLSIAADKDGAIWVGTNNGIGIISCGEQAATDLSCEAELRVVQSDQFAGYLFSGQSVRAIAVDGANRKWIGTLNGVWLLSDDGSKTIYRFTEDNSPLPSNSIERINIDPVTGDVYISTAKGLASFRSTATEGKAENDDKLYIYPNPVPTDYNGMVAVRGVAENSDVRFTDISGQLVYRTRALGGQAVWNCKDYTGRKVQSGVYLVFVVNKDGTQKATGKFMIHQ